MTGQHRKLSLAERNPVAVRAAIVGVVTAIVHALVVIGLVSPELEVAIAGAVDAVGLLVVVILSARAVTPNAKVVARVTTSGGLVGGEAAAVGVKPLPARMVPAVRPELLAPDLE